MEKYSLQVIWSDEKNAYIATSPEIPELSQAAGTTLEAVDKLGKALSTHLAERKALCEALPAPRCLEAFSGQFRLRLPRVLHAALTRGAEMEGVSLNTYIVHLLSQRHTQQQSHQQVAAFRTVQVRKTIMSRRRVPNITVVNTPSPGENFSWKNSSSATITQVAEKE